MAEEFDAAITKADDGCEAARTRVLPRRPAEEPPPAGGPESDEGGLWRRWRSWALPALTGAIVLGLVAVAGALVARNRADAPRPAHVASPSPTKTAAPTATVSVTPTASPGLTPTATPSVTPTATPSATSTGSPGATPTPSVTPTPTSGSATPTGAPAAGQAGAQGPDVERAVRRHWALIEAGRYSAAYDGFAPALRARLPRAGWIERLTHDGLRHVEVDVDVTAVSADTASARVASLRTVAAGSGCHTWTGSYALQRIDGVWRISDSQLVRHPC